MSAYRYYQQQNPGWGTQQFQFGAPPAPSFQPQPSWGGYDYYNAMAGDNDPQYFNQAWSRVRQGANGLGVGKHEARHWHRRAYGGLYELSRMMPTEIGYAAAYEAYRTWIHNSSIYEPLSGDVDRQREGMVGLAVGEAEKLYSYSNRAQDQHGRMVAAEAAAATAIVIFQQIQDEGYRENRGRMSRRSSYSGMSGVPMSGGSVYGGASPYGRRSPSPYMGSGGPSYGGLGGVSPGGVSPYGGAPSYGGAVSAYGDIDPNDPYAYDDRRSSRRRRRHSSVGRTTIIPPPGMSPGYGGGFGTASSYGGLPPPISPIQPYSQPGYVGSYPGSQGMMIPGQGMMQGGSMYAGSAGGYGVPGYAGSVPNVMMVEGDRSSRRHKKSHKRRSSSGYRY